MNKLLVVCLFVIVIFSCRPPVYTPKPSGYFKIDTPQQHQYQLFDNPDFPYTFEYPVYGSIEKDTLFSENKSKESKYWINIDFTEFGAIINLTYKEINKEQPLYRLNEESYKMSYAHHEKAEYMDHQEFRNENNVTGLLYTLGGNVATRYQFTATDSTNHFMRGALYFNVTPNSDSLKPASDFLEKDIEHLLWTLKWRK